MRNNENYERKRNVFIGFRLSKEEKERLDKYVKMSGLTFREYVARRSLQEDVIIVGNTRVYKALQNQLEQIITELKEFNRGKEPSDDFIQVSMFALKILEGMKNDK